MRDEKSYFTKCEGRFGRFFQKTNSTINGLITKKANSTINQTPLARVLNLPIKKMPKMNQPKPKERPKITG